MLTRDQARDLILDHIENAKRDTKHELVIDDDATQEHDFGWLFFVNCRQFVETRDPMLSLVGAGPIFVERDGGRLIYTGSCYSTEYMVEAYRACGDPMAHRSGGILVVLPEDTSLNRVEVLKVVRKFSGASLAEAQSWLAKLEDAQRPIPFPLAETHEPDDATRALTSIGLSVEPEWVPFGTPAGQQGGAR